MRRTRFMWLTGTFLAFSASGCSLGTGTDIAPVPQSPSVSPAPVPSVSAAPVAWREPAAYTYVLTTGCTRGFVDARYKVTVRDGRTVTSTALNQSARDHAAYRAPTLKEIDTWIAKKDIGNAGIRRERDHLDGHPVAFGFDEAATSVDGGECYEVSDYEPR